MKIIILGSSAETTLPRVEEGYLGGAPINKSRDPRDRRMRTAMAIELNSLGTTSYVLFDACPEVWEQAEKYRIADKIRYIFITHPHKDRVGGLFSRYTPYLTFALKAHWRYLEKCLVPKIKRRNIERRVINLKGIHVYSFPVFHGNQKNMMVNGYKIVGRDGESLVYLPEVRNIPTKVRKMLYNVDTMILDGSVWDRSNDWHASIREQLKWVQEYKPKKLYFTHIGDRNEPHKILNSDIKKLYPGAQVCYDGQVILIEKENNMQKFLDIINKHEFEDTTKLEDMELLSIHSAMHGVYPKLDKEGEFNGITAEKMLVYHKTILDEMESRDLKHYIEDDLDKKTLIVKNKQFELKNSSELLDNLVNSKSVLTKPAFISLRANKLDDNKIEILIKSKERNHILEAEISAFLPKQYQKNLSFVYDKYGPNASYIPLFDVVLQPRKSLTPVLVGTDMPSMLKVGDTYKPLRAELITGDIRRFMRWVDKNLDDGVFIQPIPDGQRVIVEKTESGVKILLNGTDDITDKLPDLVKVLWETEATSFILDGCLDTQMGKDVWKQEKLAQTVPLMETSTESSTDIQMPVKPKLEGEYVVLRVIDILKLNNKDLHTEALRTRLDHFGELLRGSHPAIMGVELRIATTPGQVLEGVNRVITAPFNRGVWAKIVTSSYNLDGQTSAWALFDPKLQESESKGSLDIASAGEVLVDNKVDEEIQDIVPPGKTTA